MHSLFERWERRAFEFGWLLLVKIILHHDQFALDFYSILVSDAVDGLIMLFPRINKAVKKTLSLRRWTGSKEFEALRAWKSPVWSWKFWKVSESRRIDGHGCFLWRSKKSCIYAVNVFSPHIWERYILYQCRKRCVPKLNQLKKTPSWYNDFNIFIRDAWLNFNIRATFN